MTPATLARLEELAALASGRHPLACGPGGPPDVWGLLSRLDAPPVLTVHPGGLDPRTRRRGGDLMNAPTPVRLTPELRAEAEALAVDLAAAGRPEALAAGGRWGRGAVLRLAVARGLADLRAELEVPR